MLQVTGLIVALGIIVIMVKKKRPLYQAMAAGVAVAALAAGRPPAETFVLLWQGLSSRQTLELVFAVGLISLLSRMLRDMGFLENLMKATIGLLKSAKITMVIIPFLIGLFPVVGGAIISAPLVDELGQRLQLSGKVKTSANLIFRHAVFYFSPFNPALILIAGLTGIEVQEMLRYLFPLGIVNIAAGYFLYLHGAAEKEAGTGEDTGTATNTATAAGRAAGRAAGKAAGRNTDRDTGATAGSGDTGGSANPGLPQKLYSLLFYGAPLFASLVPFLLLRLPLLLSLLAGVATALLLGDRKDIRPREIFIHGPNPLLMLGIAGIMVFQSLVVNLEGVFALVESISKSGIPLFLLFIILPFMLGWVSASFSIAVGITVPILFPLLQHSGQEVFYLLLLYTSGFTSYFISPVHLCQIVSNSYFNVRAFEAHRLQYPVILLAFLAGLLIFGLGVSI